MYYETLPQPLKEILEKSHVKLENFYYGFEFIDPVKLNIFLSKLYVFFAKVERKPIGQAKKELIDLLTLSESRINDYLYHFSEVQLPLFFGISLTRRKDDKIKVEFYNRGIYILRQKIITFPDLLPYLKINTPSKLYNNQILETQLIDFHLLNKLFFKLNFAF